MRNFAILWEVYRALIITCGITFFIIACISVCADGVDAFSGFPFDIKFIAIFVAGMLVLGFLGYVLYAAISGWKYVIRFTMTDKEIINEQMPSQVKNAEKRANRTAALTSSFHGTASAAADKDGMAIPWHRIRRIGDDVILVEVDSERFE